MFAALKLFYHNAVWLLFKGSDIIRRLGLPGRSLYSYMANVKSVVLIIGRGYTMRTRLRRDKLCTPIWVRIECDTAGLRPDSRPTYCLNNNFKRMSHCISDYSDLSLLNRDKTCLSVYGIVKKKRKRNIWYTEYTALLHYVMRNVHVSRGIFKQ